MFCVEWIDYLYGSLQSIIAIHCTATGNCGKDWTASCKVQTCVQTTKKTGDRQTPFNTGQTNLPLWADSGQVSPVRSDEAQGGTYTATPTTRNSHSVPPITNQENLTIVIIHKSIARRRCNCYSIYPKENHEFRSDVGRILA